MTDRRDCAPTDTIGEPSDAELVRQARTTSGKAAFAVLYHRYLTPVYRYLYARTGDVGLAQDLTLQTFVAVLEGLPCCRVELDGVLFAVEGPWELTWDWRGQECCRLGLPRSNLSTGTRGPFAEPSPYASPFDG